MGLEGQLPKLSPLLLTTLVILTCGLGHVHQSPLQYRSHKKEYRAHSKGDVRAEDEAVAFHGVLRREVRDIAVVDRCLISSQIELVSQTGDGLIENGGGSQTGFARRRRERN